MIVNFLKYVSNSNLAFPEKQVFFSFVNVNVFFRCMTIIRSWLVAEWLEEAK